MVHILNPSWDMRKILPIVRDTILALYEEKRNWVLEKEVVEALLEDPRISKAADEAVARGKKAGNKRNIVANMVAFLNHWITRYENGTIPEGAWFWSQFADETQRMFQRKEIRGKYAFKMREASH